MRYGAQKAKASSRAIPALLAALLACALLLASPLLAQADEATGATGSQGPNLMFAQRNDIYVGGNGDYSTIEEAINAVPDGESRTIRVKAGTYSGFKIDRNVNIKLVLDGGNVVFQTKPIELDNEASLALEGNSSNNFILEKGANLANGSTLDLLYCRAERPIQANNSNLEMRMSNMDDPASPLIGGRPNGSIDLFNSSHATITGARILGTIVVSDSVIEDMNRVTVNSQMGRGAIALTVKDSGRVERIFNSSILANPNAISLLDGSVGSIEYTNLYVSFDDAKASAIKMRGPSNIDLVKECKIEAKRAFEFTERASGDAAAPKVGAVEGTTVYGNDKSIASTADAQAQVVLEPSLVGSGKTIGTGNYHDKHGEYDEWTAISVPEGYRLSRMTRTLDASDVPDSFKDVGYRYFVATDCTLRFESNHGEGDMSAYNLPRGSEEVWADLPYTIPTCKFTYDGHKFKAWNTKPDGTGTSFLPGKSAFIFKTLNQKNVTLYAIYEGTLVTVTFDYGGDSGLARQGVWKGNKATKPDDPQRDHYDFGGWYTDAACTNPFDFDTPINSDLTLYAKWENFSSHHNWVEEKREGEVNCVSGMHVTYRCTLCNETKVEYTPPNLSIHHTEWLTNQDRHEATCTQDGYYYDVEKCKDCGFVLRRRPTTISKTGHSWGEWKAIQDSTEWKAGIQQHECTKCGATEERPYPTKLHSHTLEKIDRVDSTCISQGHVEYWYCTGCGGWFIEKNGHVSEIGPDDVIALPLADHTPGEPISENVVDPTCGANGSHDEVVYCTVCEKELLRYSVVDLATGQHTEGEPVNENVKASTCAEHGSHEKVVYCTVCNQELSREFVDDELLPHTPGEPVREDVVDPTADEDGWYDEVVYCTACGHELSRKEVVLPAHGASYSIVKGDGAEWPSGDSTGLTQVFKRSKDDETTFEHFLGIRVDGTDALLDPSSYRVEKGSVIVTLLPDYLRTLSVGEHTTTALFDDGNAVTGTFSVADCRHDNRQRIDRVESTCASNGHIEYWYCPDCCERLIEDDGALRPIEGDDEIVLPLAVHTPGKPVRENEKASTCAERGSHEEAVYCTVCNKELSREFVEDELLAHAPGEPVRENEKASTCTERGSHEEAVYCTVCNKELSRELVDDGLLAHAPGEPVRENEKVPTCAERGSHEEAVYCTVCDKELSRELVDDGLLDHTPGEPVRENEKASTCTERGSHEEATYCTACKQELSRTFVDDGLLPHTPGEPVRENEKASTCTEHGSHEEAVYCTVCDKELSRELVDDDLLEHTPGEPVRENVVDPTATEDGRYDEVVYCTACKQELSRQEVVLPASGASYSIVEGDGAEWTSDDGEGLTLIYERSEDDGTAFDHFLGIRVDGADALLDPSSYLAERGSVVVTLLPDYLRTLGVGEHTVAALFDDGNAAVGTFSVAGCRHGNRQRVERVESTCASNGHIEYWYCPDCRERLVEDGGVLRPIEGDDEIALPLAKHTPGEPVRENEKASTCAERGSHEEATYCTACKQELSRTFVDDGLLPHAPGEPVRENEKASTCTEHGSHEEATYCTACKQELSRTFVDDGLLAHAPGKPVRENEKASTCTEHGSHEEATYCTACKQELSRTFVDDGLLSHAPGKPVRENVVDPTATEDGRYDEVVYCKTCRRELSRKEVVLPAGGASYSIVEGDGAEWSCDDGEGLTLIYERSEDDGTAFDHFLGIRVDGADSLLDPLSYRVEKGSVVVTLLPDYLRTLDVEEHAITALFDDGNAVYAAFSIVDCRHGNRQRVERVESTCTSNGHIEYWYCPDCRERLVEDGDALRPIEGDDEIALPLADHTPGEPVRENEKASTCAERGSHEEAVYCTVCEQELSRKLVDDDLLPHTPGEPVRENVVDPTATEDGRYDEVVYCTACGHELSRKEVVLPAGGASYSIVEGDGAEWSSDDDAGLTLVFKRSKDDDAAFDHFLGIKVDNSDSLLDPSNYLAERGSVVVTLLPDYLKTLGVGEHTVTALFDDGNDVTTTISITEPKEEAAGDPVQPEEAKSSSVKPTSSTTSPKTGDDQRAIIVVFAALAFASLVIVLVAWKKRRNQ